VQIALVRPPTSVSTFFSRSQLYLRWLFSSYLPGGKPLPEAIVRSKYSSFFFPLPHPSQLHGSRPRPLARGGLPPSAISSLAARDPFFFGSILRRAVVSGFRSFPPSSVPDRLLRCGWLFSVHPRPCPCHRFLCFAFRGNYSPFW